MNSMEGVLLVYLGAIMLLAMFLMIFYARKTNWLRKKQQETGFFFPAWSQTEADASG